MILKNVIIKINKIVYICNNEHFVLIYHVVYDIYFIKFNTNYIYLFNNINIVIIILDILNRSNYIN